jgi:hypothetical protein
MTLADPRAREMAVITVNVVRDMKPASSLRSSGHRCPRRFARQVVALVIKRIKEDFAQEPPR